MNRGVFFCDSLHFESGRGMWRYYQQLTKHLNHMCIPLDLMSDRFKSTQRQFLQLVAHEFIEPFVAAYSRPNLLIYPFNVTSCFRPPDIAVATVVHDLIFQQKSQTTWGARYRRARIGGTISASSFLITVSATVRSQIVATFPEAVPPHVLPNHLGPDFTTLCPRSANSHHAPRIMHLGGSALSKGTILLLQAFRLVLEQIPYATLVLGAMSKHHDWLNRHLIEIGIPASRVEVLPRLTDAELAEAYANADVHCMPSSAEGFGLPIIEAASQGTPNVLAPLPVFREILGDTATYFAERTPSSVALAIITTLRGDYRERTEQARQRALGYTFDNIHRQYAVPVFEEIFAQLQSGKKNYAELR